VQGRRVRSSPVSVKERRLQISPGCGALRRWTRIVFEIKESGLRLEGLLELLAALLEDVLPRIPLPVDF
jgi:hypothetical protein